MDKYIKIAQEKLEAFKAAYNWVEQFQNKITSKLEVWFAELIQETSSSFVATAIKHYVGLGVNIKYEHEKGHVKDDQNIRLTNVARPNDYHNTVLQFDFKHEAVLKTVSSDGWLSYGAKSSDMKLLANGEQVQAICDKHEFRLVWNVKHFISNIENIKTLPDFEDMVIEAFKKEMIRRIEEF